MDPTTAPIPGYSPAPLSAKMLQACKNTHPNLASYRVARCSAWGGAVYVVVVSPTAGNEGGEGSTIGEHDVQQSEHTRPGLG